MAYSTLSVTAAAGTTTRELGNFNSIIIDSPNGPPGSPGAAIRTPHTFVGFAQNGDTPDDRGNLSGGDRTNRTRSRVSALSYADGVITVTEAVGKWLVTSSDPTSGGFDDVGSWTTEVTVDDDSNLVVDGFGIAPCGPVSLDGLSAISLSEGAR